MPPKKKKIIKKRKITKADVRRIPKMPMSKPNINLSPYDIGNMVQQMFKQNVAEDRRKMERRRVENEAERKVLQSPEIRQAMDDIAKLDRMVELQKRQNEYERRRLELDYAREALQLPKNRQEMFSIAKDERELRLSKRHNDLLESQEEETARFQARRANAKGELHALGLKTVQRDRQSAANATAKARVQAENAEERLKATKEGQKIMRTQAYIDALNKQGPKLRKAEGEAIARAELENKRIEAEVEQSKRKQKLLLEKEVEAKECEQLIQQYKDHIKTLRSNDPTSRLTGDDALLEQDLDMLGEEKSRYQQAVRELQQVRAVRHAILANNKELEALQLQIDIADYGPTIEKLYGKDPESFVRHAGNLVQLRQGRSVLSDEEVMRQVFPALAELQRDNEARFTRLSLREAELEERESTIDAREAVWKEQLQDYRVVNEQLRQQLEDYQPPPE